MTAAPGARARVRAVLALGAAALAPPAAIAQTRLRRIGLLSLFAPPTTAHPDPTAGDVQRGLADLGYVEGRNIVVERRFADNDPRRLAAMAEELVRSQVEVLVVAGQPAREAARKATATIPIVTVSGSDPVREGWARSLARPGGNVTGITFTFPELGPKRLELLKEAAPALTRVAVMIDPVEVVDAVDVLHETEAGAKRLGRQLQVIEVHGPTDFDRAFAAARAGRAQAVFAIAMFPHRARVAQLAARDRLAVIGESADEAREGYLLAYGADLGDLVRRSLVMVDKILKGASAGELPIERPVKFSLSVNLNAARALGVAVPPTLLSRADEVIG